MCLCNRGLCDYLICCQPLRNLASRHAVTYHFNTWWWYHFLLKLIFITGNAAASHSHSAMMQSLRHVTTDGMPASFQAASQASHNASHNPSQPPSVQALHNTSTRRPLASQNGQQPHMLPTRQAAQHSMICIVISRFSFCQPLASDSTAQ